MYIIRSSDKHFKSLTHLEFQISRALAKAPRLRLEKIFLSSSTCGEGSSNQVTGGKRNKEQISGGIVGRINGCKCSIDFMILFREEHEG